MVEIERYDSKSVEGQCTYDDFKSFEIVNSYNNKKNLSWFGHGRVLRTFEKTNKRLYSGTHTLYTHVYTIYECTSMFI